MFLGAARPNLLSGLFATHPPIETRLQRLYGRSVGYLDASEIAEETIVDSAGAAMGFAAGSGGSSDTNFNTRPTGLPSPLQVSPVGFHPEYGYRAVGETAMNLSLATPVVQIPAEIVQAARNPDAARALVYALLLDRKDITGYQTQIGILRQSVAQQCALVTLLYDVVETMPASMRFPVLDLAMPALKFLDPAQRQQLLGIAARLIAADQTVTQAEFVLQTVLQRRLSLHAGREVGVKYNDLAQLKSETGLLVSLMATTEFTAESAQQAYMRSVNSMPDLGLTAAQFVERDALDFFVVKQALDKFQQLAPLVKPFMIRLMLKASRDTLSSEGADLLRSVCAALDAPVPEMFDKL